MYMKLGDISDFINGGAWSDKLYVEKGHKVVKVTNMINGSVESRNDNFLSEESYRKYFKHKLYTNDLIIATAAPENIPTDLLKQLKVDGVMLLPLGDSQSQSLVKITKTEKGYTEEKLESVFFVPFLQGVVR